MKSTRFLKDSYAVSSGKIDPWGTIRILSNNIADPGNRSDAPFCLMAGLVLWSEKLVQYGNGRYYVKVLKNTVGVFGDAASLVEEILHDEFLVVNIHKALIHDDGHLEMFVERPYARWEIIYGVALRQATAGEKPKYLDNSPFIQVDKKFSGQNVIVLSWGTRSHYAVTVFAKTGERISSRVHYPLSFVRWEPQSEGAKYSVADPI